MKRVFYPYLEWEDWNAGMYRNATETAAVARSRGLLSNPAKLLEAMRRVVSEWPIATEHQLTNTEHNRRSWLGQAACCIARTSSETDTRIAWGMLTDEQRREANAVADRVIEEWEESYQCEVLF